MKQSHSIGITAASYTLPRKRFPLQECKTVTPHDTLRSFGFEIVWVTEDAEELYQMILKSAQSALVATDVFDIEALILYSGIAPAVLEAYNGLEIFEYMLPRLLHDLKLTDCRSYALSQQGCSGLVSAIELARDILQSSEKKNVLCVSGDRLPDGMQREVICNMVSDAAGALVFTRGALSNTIVSIRQRSNTALWKTSELEEQILATYFPMATRSIQKTLEDAHLSVDQIRWFIPHNVSARSWEVLSKIIPIPLEKIWLENVSRIGHTVSTDHIINLKDMSDRGLIKSGDVLFFFTFGFGAHWSSVIVKH